MKHLIKTAVIGLIALVTSAHAQSGDTRRFGAPASPPTGGQQPGQPGAPPLPWNYAPNASAPWTMPGGLPQQGQIINPHQHRMINGVPEGC
jgi:hypothetical protein